MKELLIALSSAAVIAAIGSLWDKFVLIPRKVLTPTRKLIGNAVEGSLLMIAPIALTWGDPWYTTVSLAIACGTVWWALHDIFMGILLKQGPWYLGEGKIDSIASATFLGGFGYFVMKMLWTICAILSYFKL